MESRRPENSYVCLGSWTNRVQLMFQAAISMIADLFVYLHEDKLCIFSIIQGYRAIIGQVLCIASGLDLSNNFVISLLMENFKTCSYKIRKFSAFLGFGCSAWSPRRISIWTVAQGWFKVDHTQNSFLVAWASGKRCSGIHVLRFDSFSWTEDWSRVILRPDPAFISRPIW